MRQRTLGELSISLTIIFLAVACAPDTATQFPSPLQTEPVVDSPLPTSTLSATEIAAIQETRIAEATAGAPPPTPTLLPTSTPRSDGTTCYVDRIAQFTLKLLPGWHTDVIWDRQYNVPIYNYDPESVGSEESLLPNRAKIDIRVYPLEAGESFEQWVNERRAIEADGSIPTLRLTEPHSYTLGSYSGVAYTATGYGDNVLIIKLANGDKVIEIGLFPANSLVIDEALSMPSTLDISGKDTCE